MLPVASLRFSRLILSSLLFSQQNKTAIWKVVTSRSNFPVLSGNTMNTSAMLQRAMMSLLISEGDCPIGHVMMPLQLSTAVLRFVEFLDLKRQ